MKSTQSILAYFLASVLVCTTALECYSADAANTAPNIVLIISDDQAWNDYGFMGHEQIQTPHLDQLARQSAVFPRGYVPTALCRPSLATLLTGHYASTHGITGNDPSPKYAEKSSKLYKDRCATLISFLDRFKTVPTMLGKTGYVSHQSGKLWEGSFKNAGFTHGMTRGFPQPGGRHGDDGLKIGREGLAPIKEFVNMATEKQKPFFLWYAPFLPHTPHNPPQRLFDKYNKPGTPASVARYYAMCDWFDETCGELLGLIDAKGISNDTLVIYVTDNGWIQNPKSRGYAPRSKQTPYEGGIRTPIMYRWPGKIKAGPRTEVVSSLDIVPTIIAAANAPLPAGLPGLNILPELESGKAIDRDRIFGESFAHDIADVNNPEKSLLFRWCIEGNWKLLLTYDGEVNRYQSTHPREEKRPQLFNLKDDPWETNNLAKEHPEIVKAMAAAISDWYPTKERKVLTTFE